MSRKFTKYPSSYVKADTNGISLEQAIRNAKSAARRDGYPQFVYIDSTGGYAIDRYYGQNPDWNAKELICFISPDGHIMKGVTFDDFGSQELEGRIWPLAKGYFN